MLSFKTFVGAVLALASSWLIFNGLFLTYRTMGVVSGTEFSMLITLVSLVASIALWLGVLGLYLITPVDKRHRTASV